MKQPMEPLAGSVDNPNDGAAVRRMARANLFTNAGVAIGGSFDVQKQYSSYDADAFLEQPIAGIGGGVTLQFDWMRNDGDVFLTALPKQDNYLFEAGVHLVNHRFTPLVQYAVRNFADPVTPDTNSLQAGAAFWMAGHQRNLKVTGGRLHTAGKPDQTQVLVQLQLFFY